MPFESVFLKNARRLAQMGLSELKKEKPKIDLEHVTAAQAEKILKVPRGRIAQVMPAEESTQQERVDHFDISLLVEVLNNSHNQDVDEHYYVIAEYQLGLLQAEAEPTPQQIGLYEMSWASNVFRNPHFLPKFKSADIVRELLRKAFLRAVVWCDDKILQEGLGYYDILAYGRLDEDTDVTKAVCLKIALPECPKEMSVQDYRQAIIDQLLVEPQSIDGGIHNIPLIGDGALYSKHCPELVNALQNIWEDDEDLQQWLENIQKEIPGIQDQQIEDFIRADWKDECPIIKKLTLQQKIAFEAEFGNLNGLPKKLKRIYDKYCWKSIPNKYNIPENEWKGICERGLKEVQDLGFGVELIKFPRYLLPKVFGYRLCFGNTPKLCYGYKLNGERLSDREILNIKNRIGGVGILLRTGEFIKNEAYRNEPHPVEPEKIFKGVQKGDIGEMPEDIVKAFAEEKARKERAAEQKKHADERRQQKKQKQKEKELQRKLAKKAQKQ